MKGLHLTIMVFCHVLLVSTILYLTTSTNNIEASPLVGGQQPIVAAETIIKPAQQQNAVVVEQAAAPMQKLVVIQSPVPQDEISGQQAEPIAAAAPQIAVEPVNKIKHVEDSPLSGKSSPVDAVKDAPESRKEQPGPIRKEAEKAPIVVVAKSAVEQAPVQKESSVNSNTKVDSVINEYKSPTIEEPQPVGVVVKQLEKSNVAVVQAPEVPIENKAQESPATADIKPPASVQYQAPVVIESKPVVEVKELESVKIEKVVISSKSAEPKSSVEPAVSKMDQQDQLAPAALPQPEALIAESKLQSPVDLVSGKSEQAKADKTEAKSVVVKIDEAPEMKTIVDSKVVAKLERKLDEPEQVAQQAKVAIEKPAGKVIGIVEQPAAMVESTSDMVGKKLYNPTSSAPIAPVVKGGLGPLQLLATTLCSYQPDKQVADECLNQLYSRRANLRKSLLEFMSLKFTNLEKLSSRLGSGLQVVPLKSVGDMPTPSHNSQPAPSHGWPVVGKCTAHDLKLMGEAAWCEGELGNATQVASDASPTTTNNNANAAGNRQDGEEAQYASTITSNQHASSRAQAARSIGSSGSSLSFLPSPEQSSVISKLLHVGDIKDAPVVESTIYNLNLTQQQLASLEAQATSTRECRRNALRYTKALFNHLAEDQRNISETWPHLYALINADDCARKRMIDIITALSSFRTDTTSIRRDNLEFAFAMDDLRTKVLDNEVNVPLTFDKQFIEVEQFLQQSVRLMLSNIDPNRAKLTSMRYRSLMYGTANSDDQCIELHQRLLAQSYPTDCNPNQFGQLPDVLRMTASSLELWSIEKEISLRTGKTVDYPNSDLVAQEKMREDVNECIANLVSS